MRCTWAAKRAAPVCHCQAVIVMGGASARGAVASGTLEKVNLEIGFVPLTDCAPLVMALEGGFFAKYGLDQVTLRRETNWKTLEANLRQGVLDAAQMVAGLPFAMTLGSQGRRPVPITSALTLSRNGNAITLHRRFHEAGVRSAAEFKAWIAANPGHKPVLAMVHPASMHNLMLRAWLVSAGIDPSSDVELIVIPPAQMVATLKGATTMHLLRTRGQITAHELADELGCSVRHAYRVLGRLELSRRFALVYVRPHWYIRNDDVT
jgi:ABC-type nitrate/sulfonate/bicarbonate transport system substrate-binding protein